MLFLKKINSIISKFKFFFSQNQKKEFAKNIQNKFHFGKIENEGVILVEFNHWPIFHLSAIYLCNSLFKKYLCDIKGFYNNCYLDYFLEIGLLKRLRILISFFFKFGNFQVYKALNVSKIILPKLNNSQKNYANKLFFNIYKQIKNKGDILGITISGIKIGDLIYDSFLKRYKLDTVNIYSQDFKKYLKLFIYLFIYWIDFFKNNKVKAVISSHSVYSCGVPVRIAISKNIRCFIPNSHFLYKLNKKKIFTDCEFLEFKKIFSKFSKKEKNKKLFLAKKSLEKRFLGHHSRDIFYSSNLSYKKNNFNKIILSKDKFNILIAAHSFYDSPHVYGDILFEDFGEWLDFLGTLSLKTEKNIQWYIKDGPDYPEHNSFLIDKFIKKYPAIKVIPRDCSHHYLFDKVNLVLTCYGTIAHEYAYFGVPVLNASKNNPHNNYNFCIHPKNLKIYKNIILNAKKLKLKINKNHIYEFYFMRYLFYKRGWNLNWEDFMDKYGYKNLFSEKLYDYWSKNFIKNEHIDIQNKLDNFIDNKEYIFQR
jgi:hypothetical protein